MDRTVGKIITQHYATYRATHGAPGYVHRAARQLSACRTPRLGGHVQTCPEGHVERFVYHSCRHRLCPQCSAVPTALVVEASRTLTGLCPSSCDLHLAACAA